MAMTVSIWFAWWRGGKATDVDTSVTGEELYALAAKAAKIGATHGLYRIKEGVLSGDRVACDDARVGVKDGDVYCLEETWIVWVRTTPSVVADAYHPWGADLALFAADTSVFPYKEAYDKAGNVVVFDETSKLHWRDVYAFPPTERESSEGIANPWRSPAVCACNRLAPVCEVDDRPWGTKCPHASYD